VVCFDDFKDMKQKESAPNSLKESNMGTNWLHS